MALTASLLYPSFHSAEGTVWLTILIMPPPTSFLYFTSAKSGSTPVVSQSIMKPMVPVGASTVTCALRYPKRSPRASASSQLWRLPSSSAEGTFSLLILLTDARCMRITFRNGSWFTYQPGHAPPQVAVAAPLMGVTFSAMAAEYSASGRLVAGVSHGQDCAMRADCKYDSPHMMAVTQAA